MALLESERQCRFYLIYLCSGFCIFKLAIIIVAIHQVIFRIKLDNPWVVLNTGPGT